MSDSYSILDFGAGNGTLGVKLQQIKPEIEYTPYDPAMPGIDRLPEDRSDLVVAIDVMEHVEEEYIDEVLQSIYDRARKAVWLLISTVPAAQKLPDGRNAHISLFPASWWRRKLCEFVWDDYTAQIEPNSLQFYARKQEESSVE